MLCHVYFTTMQNHESKFSSCSVGLSGESYSNLNSQTLGTPNFQCQKIKSSLQAAKSVSTKIFGSKFFTTKFYTNRIIPKHFYQMIFFTIAHILFFLFKVIYSYLCIKNCIYKEGRSNFSCCLEFYCLIKQYIHHHKMAKHLNTFDIFVKENSMKLITSISSYIN